MTGYVGDDRSYTFIDHVWVYKMMYAVVNTWTSPYPYYNGIIKIYGNPRDTSDSDGTLTVEYNYFRPYWGYSRYTVRSIQGLE